MTCQKYIGYFINVQYLLKFYRNSVFNLPHWDQAENINDSFWTLVTYYLKPVLKTIFFHLGNLYNLKIHLCFELCTCTVIGWLTKSSQFCKWCSKMMYSLHLNSKRIKEDTHSDLFFPWEDSNLILWCQWFVFTPSLKDERWIDEMIFMETLSIAITKLVSITFLQTQEAIKLTGLLKPALL